MIHILWQTFKFHFYEFKKNKYNSNVKVWLFTQMVGLRVQKRGHEENLNVPKQYQNAALCNHVVVVVVV